MIRLLDDRDLAIEIFADSETDLRAQVVRAEIERDAYRELAQAAIAELHEVTMERDRRREQQRRERDEHRRLRESVLREGVAA